MKRLAQKQEQMRLSRTSRKERARLLAQRRLLLRRNPTRLTDELAVNRWERKFAEQEREYYSQVPWGGSLSGGTTRVLGSTSRDREFTA